MQIRNSYTDWDVKFYPHGAIIDGGEELGAIFFSKVIRQFFDINVKKFMYFIFMYLFK
jgi:hypothetical protein